MPDTELTYATQEQVVAAREIIRSHGYAEVVSISELLDEMGIPLSPAMSCCSTWSGSCGPTHTSTRSPATLSISPGRISHVELVERILWIFADYRFGQWSRCCARIRTRFVTASWGGAEILISPIGLV
jgi:hypothetical protein